MLTNPIYLVRLATRVKSTRTPLGSYNQSNLVRLTTLLTMPDAHLRGKGICSVPAAGPPTQGRVHTASHPTLQKGTRRLECCRRSPTWKLAPPALRGELTLEYPNASASRLETCRHRATLRQVRTRLCSSPRSPRAPSTNVRSKRPTIQAYFR